MTRGCDIEAYRQEHPELSGLLILRDSDSHYLETLADEPGFLQLEDRSTAAVLKSCGAGWDESKGRRRTPAEELL